MDVAFANCFSFTFPGDPTGFLLYSVNVMDDIDCISNVKLTCIPGMNPTLSLCYFLCILLDSMC